MDSSAIISLLRLPLDLPIRMVNPLKISKSPSISLHNASNVCVNSLSMTGQPVCKNPKTPSVTDLGNTSNIPDKSLSVHENCPSINPPTSQSCDICKDSSKDMDMADLSHNGVDSAKDVDMANSTRNGMDSHKDAEMANSTHNSTYLTLTLKWT